MSHRPFRRSSALLGGLAAAASGLTAPLVAQGVPTAGPVAKPGGFVHEVWTMEDGLPISHLTGVIQTADGYLWLSSYDGLIRFDGAGFTVFNTTTNPELPTNRFRQVVEGPEGDVWAVADYDHLVRWRRGTFEVYPIGSEFRGTPVHELVFDESGTPWLGSHRGAFVLGDGSLELFQGFRTPALSPKMFLARDGAVWFGTDGAGAVRVAGDRAVRTPVGADARSRWAGAFTEGPDGVVYIGTGDAVLEYHDGVTRALLPPGIDRLFVRALEPMGGDTTLVVTDLGTFTLHGGELALHHGDIRARSSNPVGHATSPTGDHWVSVEEGRLYRNGELVLEAGFPILGMVFDREGSLWLASNGLHRLKPAVFRTYGEPEGGVDNVYPILEDSAGRIWMGSLGQGLAILEDGGLRRLADHETGPTVIQSLLETRDGRLLIGFSGYGACVLEGDRCGERVGGLAGHTVAAMYQDRAGSIWFGTNRGLYRESSGTLTAFSTDDGLPHDFVRAILEARDGSLWLGTNGGGLARFAEGRFESLRPADGLSSDLIRSLHEDASGVIWVGSEDRGLNRVELVATPSGFPTEGASLSEAEITVIRRSDGLFDDGIHAIVDDGLGRLWMSTNRGIFWVLRSELEAFAQGRVGSVHSISYGERDGLRNREANGGVQSPALRAGDGRLWFATQAGAVVVDPAEVVRADLDFPVRIEEVTVEGHIIPGSGLAPVPGEAASGAPRGIQLAAGDRDFEIAYTALSFLAPENLRFQYRLDPFQDRWVDAGNRRTAFFTKVSPGRHTFRVRATSGDGVWHEQEAPLAVIVDRFFYETRWFQASIAGGFVLLLLGSVRLRESRHRSRARELAELVDIRTATIRAQAARLQQLDEDKSRLFANVSHEFRTPLTLTIGPLEDLLSGVHGPISESTTEQLELSLRNSRRLLRLVNQLLDVAKIEGGVMALRASPGDLVSFVDKVALAFVPLAERKSITFTRTLPRAAVEACFDPELLEKVVMNLLSNAFKFTPSGGRVRLLLMADFDSGDGTARIEVRDSGPGIPEGMLPHLFERFYRGEEHRGVTGTGIGLTLARELAELHGGTIEVRSEEGFGSTFTVSLPLGRAHLDPSRVVADQPASGNEAAASAAHVSELSEGEPEPFDAHRQGTAARPNQGAAAVANHADGEPDDRTTVLLVDDSDDIRTYLRRHLESTYRILQATNGREGLEIARAHTPDLVVSDVMMPVMDGRELCRSMKADPELDFIPVLLLTARASPESKLEGLSLGADDYLTKPFDTAELAARVHNLIESRRQLRERLRQHRPITASPVEARSKEDVFIEKLRDAVEERMSDPDFDVDALARAVAESRSNLYRRLQELGLPSAAELIRSIRLQRAAQLLEAHAGSVGEVAYAVGFRSVSHFSRCFRAELGHSPSQHRTRIASEG